MQELLAGLLSLLTKVGRRENRLSKVNAMPSFDVKVLNCRLSVDLLPSLESIESKAESRPSKVGQNHIAIIVENTFIRQYVEGR